MPLSGFNIQRKIKDGDIGEFERLFTKYYKPLCHYADKIVKDMDTAEDLVQDFFYQFWKNRTSFSLKLSLNAYLYQSIRNNALHYLKHLTVRKNHAEFVFNEFRDKAPSEIFTDAEYNDLGKLINATLKEMPERCARIFRMNRFEGKKYREIAMILSVSVKTVEAEMGKALKLFRISLKDYTREGSL